MSIEFNTFSCYNLRAIAIAIVFRFGQLSEYFIDWMEVQEMPRMKKEKLKIRKDGRYVTKYKGHSFYGKTSEEAISKREAYKKEEYSGNQAVLNSPLLSVFAERWLKSTKPTASYGTKQKDQCYIRKLINRFGDKKIKDIKPVELKEFYSDTFLTCSDSYIKSASRVYKNLFDAAVENGYCKTNPARMHSAEPHKGYKNSHRSITPEERNWILSNCKDHKLYPAVIAMLYAGIRPPEAKALNIDKAFDRKNMALSLTEFVHIKDNNHYEVTTTGKTKNSRRKIPVFPPLYEAIKNKTGFLIPTKDGKTITVQAWKSAWNSYVTQMETAINGCPKRWYGKTKEHKAMLDAGETLPPWRSFTVVPYDLRHSFCTMCRDNGVEINTCIHWMGHSDATMILKIYDEVSEDRSSQEAEKLSQKLFES